MSNIEKFKEKLKADSSLLARTREIEQEYAKELSRLSAEAGVPCAPEEFLPSTELAASDLDRVAGGFTTNILPTSDPV